MVEGHSKASGLGEVFDLMHAPANFPLSQLMTAAHTTYKNPLGKGPGDSC